MERPEKPLVLGLTGGIGVGKSTAARAFAELGALIVDGDAIGREILEPGGNAVDAVIEAFGEAVRHQDGGIDRAALAGIVFGHPEQLKRLTDISYPAINRELERIVAKANGKTDLVVLDLAVLVEGELGKGLYSKVLVIEAPLDIRLERLEARGMSRQDAEARMSSQATEAERRAVADFIINNNDDERQLVETVVLLHEGLTSAIDHEP